jgi:hypothetical protein
MHKQEAITDLERLTLIQEQVIKLRRLAADISDLEVSTILYSVADLVERRSREAERRQCSPE